MILSDLQLCLPVHSLKYNTCGAAWSVQSQRKICVSLKHVRTIAHWFKFLPPLTERVEI